MRNREGLDGVRSASLGETNAGLSTLFAAKRCGRLRSGWPNYRQSYTRQIKLIAPHWIHGEVQKMDKQLGIMMLNFIEHQNIENLALRALVQTVCRNAYRAQIDPLLKEAMNDQATRDTVHAQWLPLRQQIEAGVPLEEVIEKFAKIAPPEKGSN